MCIRDRDNLLGAEYDCLLLDIMMPKKDGHAVLRAVRAQGSTVPVIFLTARDSVQDRIEGLDLGADDYLVKPFDFDELLARIRAATRKYSVQKTSVLTLADLTVDTSSRTVTRGGKEIRLSAKEYACLLYTSSVLLRAEARTGHADGARKPDSAR